MDEEKNGSMEGFDKKFKDLEELLREKAREMEDSNRRVHKRMDGVAQQLNDEVLPKLAELEDNIKSIKADINIDPNKPALRTVAQPILSAGQPAPISGQLPTRTEPERKIGVGRVIVFSALLILILGGIVFVVLNFTGALGRNYFVPAKAERPIIEIKKPEPIDIDALMKSNETKKSNP